MKQIQQMENTAGGSSAAWLIPGLAGCAVLLLFILAGSVQVPVQHSGTAENLLIKDAGPAEMADILCGTEQQASLRTVGRHGSVCQSGLRLPQHILIPTACPENKLPETAAKFSRRNGYARAQTVYLRCQSTGFMRAGPSGDPFFRKTPV